MTQQNSHKNRSHVNLVFSSKRGSHFFSLQPFLHSSFFFFPFRTHSSHSKDKHYPQVFLRTRSNWGVVLIVIDRDHDRCIADATPRDTNYISPFFFFSFFSLSLRHYTLPSNSNKVVSISYHKANVKSILCFICFLFPSGPSSSPLPGFSLFSSVFLPFFNFFFEK